MTGPVQPILEGRGLERTYRLGATRVRALVGVDIEIHRGDFVVLQGPSGSGKTTLINLLGFLDRPDAGKLYLEGRTVAEMNENTLSDLRRDRFGFVFQTFSLVPVLTAVENVEYPMILKGISRGDRRKRATELLGRVGLETKASVRPDLLSGGERQRVAIARAVANDPEIIFADEPTANLDTHTADEILDLIRELNDERNVAAIVATHDPRVVSRARRVLGLRDGRVVDDG
jgi:putative ABC transport system ATP-binding protein